MSNTLFDNNIIDDNDQTRARAAHLEEIKELVGNAYPNKFTRTSVTETPEGEDTITSVVGEFEKHVPKLEAGARPTPEQLEAANAELGKFKVSVSGRLATPPRVMGKVAFVHLSDGKERLQIYVRKQEAQAISNDSGTTVEEFESGWKLFQLLDHGDFAGVEGKLFVTKTGELSVHVETIQFLSKALLPMPDKLHGINDPEIRQRQRYADLIASSLKIETGDEGTGERELTTREVFVRRSKIITTMRRHLDDHGYIEVETPMLSPIATGAAARPFKTHHNALDIDLYARIAPELYLKRLVVGGFERVYELNRNFRNEGISTRHNPEFTMLEFYTAYKDVNWMMDFCEEMIRTNIKSVTEKTKLNFRSYLDDHELDFGEKFDRLSMKEAIAIHIDKNYKLVMGRAFDSRLLDDPIHVRSIATAAPELWGTPNPDELELIQALLEGKMETSHTPAPIQDEEGLSHAIEFIFGELVEKELVQPTFITDFPKAVSPLSKASPDNPAIAERFELYIAGMEVANGFSELNDPAEQYERFKDQTKQRESGDDEAMQMDEDYVKALAYGMPPAAGIGIGIDRLTMLLTNRRSIRDVILFPHMRPKSRAEESEETATTEASHDGSDNS
ncbi:MAG: lysine--tRNA ligase [Rubrivivax sp.]|nr:lysine--tRNA ligase [Pyrinomonadaceae bacterium]